MAKRNREESEAIHELFKAVRCLKRHEEFEAFLKDLLSVRERHAIPKRWLAAIALQRGRTLAKVHQELRMAVATLVRVHQALESGAGGYRLVLKRLFPKKRG